MKRRIFFLCLLPIVAQMLNLFVFHFRERFHPREFIHGFRSSFAQDVPELDYTALNAILEQPYHYLGHGKQMVALESRDGQYVLKLFNPMRPLKKQWYKRWRYWKRYSSLKWIKREWFTKKARLKKLFKRHKMAYEHLREETGLVFVHLKHDPLVNYLIAVTDQRGRHHTLPLRNTPFILQKKATLVPTYLTTLIEQGNREQASHALEELERLFDRRIEEKITDRIQTMENNFGFADGRAIQIDVGRIRPLKGFETDERERVLGNFYAWIDKTYPTLSRDGP